VATDDTGEKIHVGHGEEDCRHRLAYRASASPLAAGFDGALLILSALPEHRVEILAALTTGLRIESAIFLPAMAFNMANAVIIGNLLARKSRRRRFEAGW